MTEAHDASPGAPVPHRARVRATGIATVAVIALLLAWWAWFRAGHALTDDAFVESDLVGLAPRVGGQIVDMRVADTDMVTRGQMLAQIDPVPYQRRLAQAEAALRVAEAEHAAAAAAHAQAPAPGAGVERQIAALVEAQGQLVVAAQRAEAARAAVAEAQAQLDYTALVAPFDGVVAKRFKFRGDYGTAGVPVFSLYEAGNLYVTVHVEETRLAGIGPGQPAEVEVDAIAGAFEGRVRWVGKATGAQFALMPRDLSSGEFTKVIQRVPVRIELLRQPGDEVRWAQLRPGLSASVAITQAAAAGAGASVAAR